MRISLGAKFITLAVIIELLALGISGYLTIKTEQDLLMKNLLTKGQSLGRFTALISIEAVLAYDFVVLDTIVEEITKDNDVAYAIIENATGDPLTTFRPSVKGIKDSDIPPVPLSALQLEKQFETEKSDILVLHFPVLNDGNTIANLTLGLKKNLVNDTHTRILKSRLIELAALLPILIGALYIAFRSLVVKPIWNLKHALSNVANGAFSSVVKIQSQDEIGDLGQTFNHMSKRLYELNEDNIQINYELEIKAMALEKLNEHLEDLVKQRTQDLELKADKLARSNKELDKFAYVTSHDLKAPLRAIASLSEWIEEDLEGVINNEAREHLKILRARVHRLEALINSILKYSQAGKIDMELERIDVSALVNEVVSSLDLSPAFTIDVARDMPAILTARVPVMQVFSNLITNAVFHHDNEQGHICVYCEEPTVQTAGFYTFVVRDDGPGIKPVYHEKIFEIFQTLRSRDEFESTGIGLALVKRIVLELGGDIGIGAAPGRGSEFKFTLAKH